MKTINLLLLNFIYLMPLGLIWSCSSAPAQPGESKIVPKVRGFKTIVAAPGNITHEVNITGRVIPRQKIAVVAQVQGMAMKTTKPFEAGVSFKRGETLVAINDAEFRYNLNAKKSQFLSALVAIMADVEIDYPKQYPAWKTYLSKIIESKPLPLLPSVTDTQFRYFLSSRNIFTNYYQIKSQEDVLSRYRILAPFDGAVIEAAIDPGGLVQPGAQLGVFTATSQYELASAVSINDVESLQIGQTVAFTSRGTKKSWEGQVSRIDKRVDPSTQAVTVYFALSGDFLREGMYLEGALLKGYFEDVVELPRSLLSRQNQIHLIEDSTVILKAVNPVAIRSSTVVVSGLAAGDRVVAETVYSPIEGIKAIAK